MSRDRVRDELLDRSFFANVDRREAELLAERSNPLRDPLTLLLVDVAADHVRPGVREGLREHRTTTARRPGDSTTLSANSGIALQAY